MKFRFGLAFLFAVTSAAGWASVPSSAECRMCYSKTCSSDRSCGKRCTCVWEGGKTYKRGKCYQVGD